MWSSELAEQFPAVDVRPDVLYLDAGQVLTTPQAYRRTFREESA
jgi:transcriptional regulator GlxA family with amidase domain